MFRIIPSKALLTYWKLNPVKLSSNLFVQTKPKNGPSKCKTVGVKGIKYKQPKAKE